MPDPQPGKLELYKGLVISGLVKKHRGFYIDGIYKDGQSCVVGVREMEEDRVKLMRNSELGVLKLGLPDDIEHDHKAIEHLKQAKCDHFYPAFDLLTHSRPTLGLLERMENSLDKVDSVVQLLADFPNRGVGDLPDMKVNGVMVKVTENWGLWREGFRALKTEVEKRCWYWMKRMVPLDKVITRQIANPLKVIVGIMKQLVPIVYKMNARGVLLGDLKSMNVLLQLLPNRTLADLNSNTLSFEEVAVIKMCDVGSLMGVPSINISARSNFLIASTPGAESVRAWASRVTEYIWAIIRRIMLAHEKQSGQEVVKGFSLKDAIEACVATEWDPKMKVNKISFRAEKMCRTTASRMVAIMRQYPQLTDFFEKIEVLCRGGYLPESDVTGCGYIGIELIEQAIRARDPTLANEYQRPRAHRYGQQARVISAISAFYQTLPKSNDSIDTWARFQEQQTETIASMSRLADEAISGFNDLHLRRGWIRLIDAVPGGRESPLPGIMALLLQTDISAIGPSDLAVVNAALNGNDRSWVGGAVMIPVVPAQRPSAVPVGGENDVSRRRNQGGEGVGFNMGVGVGLGANDRLGGIQNHPFPAHQQPARFPPPRIQNPNQPPHPMHNNAIDHDTEVVFPPSHRGYPNPSHFFLEQSVLVPPPANHPQSLGFNNTFGFEYPDSYRAFPNASPFQAPVYHPVTPQSGQNVHQSGMVHVNPVGQMQPSNGFDRGLGAHAGLGVDASNGGRFHGYPNSSPIGGNLYGMGWSNAPSRSQHAQTARPVTLGPPSTGHPMEGQSMSHQIQGVGSVGGESSETRKKYYTNTMTVKKDVANHSVIIIYENYSRPRGYHVCYECSECRKRFWARRVPYAHFVPWSESPCKALADVGVVKNGEFGQRGFQPTMDGTMAQKNPKNEIVIYKPEREDGEENDE